MAPGNDGTDPADAAPRDEDSGERGSRTPLSALVSAIEARREARADLPDPLREERSGTDRPDPEEVWERLEGSGGRRIPSVDGTRSVDAARRRTGGMFPAYPSRAILVAHGMFTTGTLAVGAAIYLFSAIGAIPEHLWILALPFLALGLFGALPIVSWRIGIWQPRELQ